MGADAYFVLTALPALDPPGSAPPLTPGELLEWAPAGRPRALVRCIILSDDLLQREAALAGELATPTPGVLTPEQTLGTAPLPDDIVPPDPAPGSAPPDAAGLRTPADVVWSGYYRWAAALAGRLRSPFLREWVGSEVAVRNALAVARARSLGLDPAHQVVVRELEGGAGGAADAVVAAIAASPDPLAGLRELIALRWRWIEHAEPAYSFSDDELAVYAARLVLLHRWRRSAGEGGRRVAGAVAAGGGAP